MKQSGIAKCASAPSPREVDTGGYLGFIAQPFESVQRQTLSQERKKKHKKPK